MNKEYLKYFLALLLFGSNGIVASHISLTSYEIVFMRTMIGSILLIFLFAITKQECSFTKNKNDLLFITLSGIAMGVSWMFLYEAYAQVGVSLASLAYYCGPMIVMILSPILFREKLTWVKVVGFVAVIIGIVFVNGKIIHDGLQTWGLFCGGVSAVMYAAMVIFNKKSEQIKGLENSTIQLLMSFLIVAAFVGMKNGFALRINGNDWILIIILGLLNTGIGCYFYFSSIGKLPVQTVAICGYVEPLSAVIFSIAFLNESMLPRQIVGAILIIGGAIFSECLHHRL
jgi:drug/metabolite transporter (DMT)-like permease